MDHSNENDYRPIFIAKEIFFVKSRPSPSAESRAVPASHWPTGRPVATADWSAGRYGPGSPPPSRWWRPTGASCARQGQPGCGSWPPPLPLRPLRGSHHRPLSPPLRCSRRREKRSCLQYTQMVSEPVFRIRIHLIRIRIQHFRLNNNPDPDPHPIWIQGFHDQK
jgi:hypothetical protein